MKHHTDSPGGEGIVDSLSFGGSFVFVENLHKKLYVRMNLIYNICVEGKFLFFSQESVPHFL